MHITVGEAQQFFNETKLAITELDAQLEDFVVSLVFADLSDKYNTLLWIDETNTPPVVRKIIALYYAAYYYQRTYSHDDDLSNYASWLLNQGRQALLALSTGASDIPGVTPEGLELASTADYWPNDTAVGPWFTMEQIF